MDLSDAQLLANSLTSIQQQVELALYSFGVSYNPGIETGGAQALLSSLPKNVNKFGIVGCQLGDDVGESLIKFMARSRKLKMICVKDNLFSPQMRSQIALAGKSWLVA